MREAVRLRRASIAAGWDLVFIARSTIARTTFAEISRAIENLLRRAKLQVLEE
jgi:ribonuclease P protein component